MSFRNFGKFSTTIFSNLSSDPLSPSKITITKSINLFLLCIFYLCSNSLQLSNLLWNPSLNLSFHYCILSFRMCVWLFYVIPCFLPKSTIYLSSHLFVLAWTRGYLFYTLGYNPMLHYCVVQIILALVIRSYFSNSCIPVTYPSLWDIFCLWNTDFNTAYLGSSRILPVPVLQRAVSPW